MYKHRRNVGFLNCGLDDRFTIYDTDDQAMLAKRVSALLLLPLITPWRVPCNLCHFTLDDQAMQAKGVSAFLPPVITPWHTPCNLCHA